jgi:hypothetical protein
MSTHEELPPELKALEAELSSLAPQTETIDCGRLMYQAGRASAARERRVGRLAWPSAFAAMTAVAATLTLMLVFATPEPRVIERVVHLPVERTSPPESVDTPDPPGIDVPQVPESEGERPRGPQFDRSDTLASAGWIRPAPSTYPYLRNRLLIEGVDAWRPAAPSSDDDERETPTTYRAWAKELRNEGSL